MSKSKNKFFVVWEGKTPGIYKSWNDCKKQIHEFTGAKYKGFETEKEATEAYNSSYWNYVGKNAKKPTPQFNTKAGIPVWESISVDAACSGNPGLMEYQGVNTATKERIFHQGPFEEGTNNIGEFLALVHGLALLKKNNSNLPIYSDSITALAWVRNKKVKTELEQTDKNKVIFDLIQRAEKWLKENTYTTKVLKWETATWGEIPADFGRKK